MGVAYWRLGVTWASKIVEKLAYRDISMIYSAAPLMGFQMYRGVSVGEPNNGLIRLVTPDCFIKVATRL